MAHHQVREWCELQIGDDRGALSRTEAERLLSLAGAAQERLGLGTDGERVLTPTRRGLRAGQVVGVIAGGDVSLEILPKIDTLDEGATRANLVRMLARTLDLALADGELAALGVQRHDLLEVLIALFCKRLFAAVHRGLSRRYIEVEDELGALRGRLRVERQFTVLAATPHKLACRFSELSADIALNQVLKAAVRKLRLVSRSPANQRLLFELELAFAEVSAVPTAALDYDKVVLDRTNTAYRDLFELAKLFLRQRYQTTSVGGARAFTLLFEMNTLFEEYVGRTLRTALARDELRVTLQGPTSHALVDEAGRGRFMTRPDIVVHAGGRPAMVLDTKWKQLASRLDDAKQGVSQADVYQMMAYGQVYDVDELALFYPHHGGLASQAGALSVGRLGGREERRLVIASLDLADMATVAGQLRRLVVGMMGAAAVKAA